MVAKMVIMEHRLFVMAQDLLQCTFIVDLLCTDTVVLNVNVLNWKDIPVVTRHIRLKLKKYYCVHYRNSIPCLHRDLQYML